MKHRRSTTARGAKGNHVARGPSTFRQQDVTRAIRAAVKAGMEVRSFEVSKDKIVVMAAKRDELEKVVDAPNEWDGAA